MCDTLVALGNVTEGVTILGKNSDREPNDAHHLLRLPAARHAPGSRVKCTYIEIPQVERTYVCLARPHRHIFECDEQHIPGPDMLPVKIQEGWYGLSVVSLCRIEYWL